MSDPVLEAAQRAIGLVGPDEFTNEVGDTALAAAREALKPIREALSEAIQVAASGTVGTTPMTISGVNKGEALDIMSNALLAVRSLIYATNEP